eukprot:1154520-Pelagomonas_calceolata.AAC.5
MEDGRAWRGLRQCRGVCARCRAAAWAARGAPKGKRGHCRSMQGGRKGGLKQLGPRAKMHSLEGLPQYAWRR